MALSAVWSKKFFAVEGRCLSLGMLRDRPSRAGWCVERKFYQKPWEYRRIQRSKRWAATPQPGNKVKTLVF